MNRRYESESVANAYSKYRGVYPRSVADIILGYLASHKNGGGQVADNEQPDFMVEVGCGSGQATKWLAPAFKRVYATDVSPNQIKYARENNDLANVTYCEGTAERIDVEDRSCDIVFSAEAAHWFNLPKFFAEASRVLKPDGCLVLVCYYFPELRCPGVEKSGEISGQVLQETLDRTSYDRDAYREIESHYRGIFEKIPTADKERRVEKSSTGATLATYKMLLRSVDAFQVDFEEKREKLRAEKGELTAEDLVSIDEVEYFVRETKRRWKVEDTPTEQVKVELKFTFAVIFAQHLKPT